MSSQPSQPANLLATSTFRNHSAELHRYLARRIRHVHDADDLGQEVFARLLRVKDTDLIRRPVAYLMGIATHVVREYMDRKRSERVLFDSELVDNICDRPEEIPQTGHAEQLELQDRLDKALAQLPPTHRLLVLLVNRDGMTHLEAARTSGLSVHTVEKYIVESRARLTAILEDWQ